jgi:protein-tyrosine-phosphatase
MSGNSRRLGLRPHHVPRPTIWAAAAALLVLAPGRVCLDYGCHAQPDTDWELDDPSGKTVEEIRPIRGQIRDQVTDLLQRLIAQ